LVFDSPVRTWYHDACAIGTTFSAASGAEIRSTNTLLFAHPNELVLPADISAGIRKMAVDHAAGRDVGGGGNHTLNQNVSIQSLDPSKLSDIVMANPNLFGSAVAAAIRSGS
jgi:hypothetical protein